MADATPLGTTAIVGCAHKAAHSPFEQQRSQFTPCGMLPQGTSTGAYAKIGPWNVSTRSNTATMLRRSISSILSRNKRGLPVLTQPSQLRKRSDQTCQRRMLAAIEPLKPREVARLIAVAIARPAHVAMNEIVVRKTRQIP